MSMEAPDYSRGAQFENCWIDLYFNGRPTNYYSSKSLWKFALFTTIKYSLELL